MNPMIWKYGVVPHNDGFEGVRVAEIHEDGCYALLDGSDWYYNTREDVIATLKMIIEDLERD